MNTHGNNPNRLLWGWGTHLGGQRGAWESVGICIERSEGIVVGGGDAHSGIHWENREFVGDPEVVTLGGWGVHTWAVVGIIGNL